MHTLADEVGREQRGPRVRALPGRSEVTLCDSFQVVFSEAEFLTVCLRELVKILDHRGSGVATEEPRVLGYDVNGLNTRRRGRRRRFVAVFQPTAPLLASCVSWAKSEMEVAISNSFACEATVLAAFSALWARSGNNGQEDSRCHATTAQVHPCSSMTRIAGSLSTNCCTFKHPGV